MATLSSTRLTRTEWKDTEICSQVLSINKLLWSWKYGTLTVLIVVILFFRKVTNINLTEQAQLMAIHLEKSMLYM